MGSHYIPPVNFGMVEEDLYRSGEPNVLNFPFLEKLQIKQVIYLASEGPSKHFLNFLDDQKIVLHHVGIDAKYPTQQDGWISEDMVISALKLILDPKNYPLVVMCNLGKHRTGTVIGCLRKLQKWNLASIFGEYRRFAGNKVHLLNEQFIELFDTDLLALPADHPSWACYPSCPYHQQNQN